MAPRVRSGGSGQAPYPQRRSPAAAENAADADDLRLLRRAGAGDPDAQTRLFSSYSPLAAQAARRQAGDTFGYEDLFQEASLGLVEAIREFSGSDLVAFVAFAESRIGLRIDEALATEREAQEAARRLLADVKQYETIELRLAGELKRRPTAAELAARLEWSIERTNQVAAILEEARRRHDQELLEYLDPEEPEGGGRANGSGS
jgi:RNA polymerase sigma-B factor